ncbi:hypothetical protein ACFLXQ_05430 [Chloroflexota bacterium]
MKLVLLTAILLLPILACDEEAAPEPPATSPSPESVDAPTASAATPTVNTSAPVAKGNRILGIDVAEAEDGDFNSAMGIAQSAGADAVSLTVFWNDIEKQPGQYQPDPNWLEVANAYYPTQQAKVGLVIPVIDTVTKRVPAIGQSCTAHSECCRS